MTWGFRQLAAHTLVTDEILASLIEEGNRLPSNCFVGEKVGPPPFQNLLPFRDKLKVSNFTDNFDVLVNVVGTYGGEEVVANVFVHLSLGSTHVGCNSDGRNRRVVSSVSAL